MPTLMPGATRYVHSADGTPIAYSTTPGKTPPFLSIGTPGQPPMSLRLKIPNYQAVAQAMRGDRSSLRFDHRCTGQSGGSDLPVTLDALVHDLEAVTGTIDGPVDVFSFGKACFESCTFAAANPGSWRSLVLVDASVRAQSNPQFLMNRPGWELDYVEHLKIIASRYEWEGVEDAANQWVRGVPPQAFAAFIEVERHVDLTAILPQIEIPVLVTSQLDSSGAAAQELAGLLPNSTLLGGRPGPAAFIRQDWDRHIGVLFDDPAANQAEDCPLTPRELDVLRLLAGGQRNQEIADELGISRHTVIRHVSNIYAKLDVRSRADAVGWALRNGYA